VVEDEVLIGIVTDRDLRTRVLAAAPAGHAPARRHDRESGNHRRRRQPVRNDAAHDARGFHHLPVLEAGRLAGIVTTSDLILARG
jgi:CBS domain-containing protein